MKKALASVILCLLLACAAFAPAAAKLGGVDGGEALQAAIRKVGKLVERELQERAAQAHRRLLGTRPPDDPPHRVCGETINTVTPGDVQDFLDFFVNTVFSAEAGLAAFRGLALSALSPIVRYGFKAEVVCGSCDEIHGLYNESDFVLDGDAPDGFLQYCGPDRYASDVQYSSLLLTPTDPLTGEPIVGVVNSHLFMKYLYFPHRFGPSETWPSNIADLNNIDSFIELFYLMDPIFVATSGVVVVAPDYLGYCQTYQHPKAFISKRQYQQAGVIALLKSKAIVEETGCTLLSNAVSGMGYSEGGYSVVAAALAYDALGLDVIDIHSSSGPFRWGVQMSFAVQEFDLGIATDILKELVPTIGASYSSTNPDLPNSAVGQDLLSEEWMQTGNYSLDVIDWLSSNINGVTMRDLLPDSPLDVFNQTFVQSVRDLLAQNISDACAVTIEGANDVLCQTGIENSLIDQVQATTFPIKLCSSPDDKVVTITSSLPDYDANPLLSELTLLGTTATGNHGEAGLFCHLASLFQFTDLGPRASELSAVGELPDPSQCRAGDNETDPPAAAAVMPSSVSPVTVPPTPMPVTVLSVEPTSLVTPAPSSSTPPPSQPDSAPTPAPISASPDSFQRVCLGLLMVFSWFAM